MRIGCLVIALILLLPVSSLAIEGKEFGIGVIAGDIDGITGKYMLENNCAIAAGVGWKTSGDNEYRIYGDYLLYRYDLIEVQSGKLPVYFGAGVRYISLRQDEEAERDEEDEKDEEKIGIRIPVGIEYFFWDASFRFFVELVPTLNLTPNTDVEFETGIGIRFFF